MFLKLRTQRILDFQKIYSTGVCYYKKSVVYFKGTIILVEPWWYFFRVWIWNSSNDNKIHKYKLLKTDKIKVNISFGDPILVVFLT